MPATAITPTEDYSGRTAAPARHQRAAPRSSPVLPRYRLSLTLLLLVTLLWPVWLPVAPASARPLGTDVLLDQATLETRQPEVQWSPIGAVAWQMVPSRQAVHAGDRIRTGPDAAARLVYFEGTVTEVGPETGLLVQRLERSPNGSIVAHLLQTLGTTVSYVVHLVDPAAAFEIETPAALVFVRGTTPRVDVGRDGTTRVRNIPDGTASRVGVIAQDANRTRVILLPGEETIVRPGRPPTAPTRWNNPQPTPTRSALPPVGLMDPCQWPGASCDWRPDNPCARPGVVCDPLPPPDPCQRGEAGCGPTRTPTPSPTPTTMPTDPCLRAAAGCSPSPTPTPRPRDPCQRPSVVCDPPRPDVCHRLPALCDPPGQGPNQPPPTGTPTRQPRPPGDGPSFPTVPTRIVLPDRPLPSLPVRPTRTPGPIID
jgi:hypothetical protein